MAVDSVDDDGDEVMIVMMVMMMLARLLTVSKSEFIQSEMAISKAEEQDRLRPFSPVS